MAPALTQAELQTLFRIDEAGVLVWKSHPSSRHQNLIGREAGCFDNRGKRIVCIHGRTYRTSDIEWCMTMGGWPEYVRPEKPAADLSDLDLSGFTL